MNHTAEDAIRIPAELLPADGRFGSGPSKVQPVTSTRWPPPAPGCWAPRTARRRCARLVGRVRDGLAALFSTCPTATRWCSATAAPPRSGTSPPSGWSRERSQHLVFGEFSAKFAAAVAGRAVAGRPERPHRRPGLARRAGRRGGIDAYCWAHNETSTGVMAPVRPADRRRRRRARPGRRHLGRRRPAGRPRRDRRLLLRAAEVLRLRRRAVAGHDVAPAALERAERDRGERPLRAAVLRPAHRRSTTPRKDQTYNTPPVATLFLMAEQLDWMNAQGGLSAHGRADHRLRRDPLRLGRGLVVRLAVRRRAPSTARWWSPPSTSTSRSTRPRLAAVLRANGIVDTEPYRKLGRNQLRIAMYPAVDPEPTWRGATACLDHVVAAL